MSNRILSSNIHQPPTQLSPFDFLAQDWKSVSGRGDRSCRAGSSPPEGDRKTTRREATVQSVALPDEWAQRAWAGELCATRQKAEQWLGGKGCGNRELDEEWPGSVETRAKYKFCCSSGCLYGLCSDACGSQIILLVARPQVRTPSLVDTANNPAPQRHAAFTPSCLPPPNGTDSGTRTFHRGCTNPHGTATTDVIIATRCATDWIQLCNTMRYGHHKSSVFTPS